MTKTSTVVAGLAILAIAGCGESVDAPQSVRPSRLVNTESQRIISYQAFYEDGVVTYLDYEPFGSVDLVSAERGDTLRLLVRDGFEPGPMPWGGPEAEPIDDATLAAFEIVRQGVDVSNIPWSSSAHGTLEIPRSVGAE